MVHWLGCVLPAHIDQQDPREQRWFLLRADVQPNPHLVAIVDTFGTT